MHTDEVTIDAMRHAAQVLRSVTSSVHDEARALRALRDATDAALSERLAEIEDSGAYRNEDATSAVTWARRELRLDAGETRARIAAARTMADLPRARAAFVKGEFSLEHAKLLTFSMKHVGVDETVEMEEHLTTVARAFPAGRLRKIVVRAKAIRHPDTLDEAWIKGMNRRDIRLAKTIDGWHVTGFLPIDVGARMNAVLEALSVPREAGDTRTASQRRCDGLDELLERVLAEGLPTDGTVAPQVHVVVDAGTLKDALAPDPGAVFTAGPPAELVGFGPIGRELVKHLTTGAALTPILVERIGRNERILDVGRAHRHATAKQRRAIWFRQEGTCARAGCENSVDHSHHTIHWSDGGPTDLDLLEGLCAACHRHEHASEPRAG
ncbi:HNH endonuclease [Aeromicrobium flavum]|uniref:HNH endonuclease n=1 Tax=Aeromicrobium flavum TaxID=416568 RepID=A0A512HRB2_9ACTN|nr:HNH endonuclease [Aeromicrobium flavum]GEO87976.1 HNH endonuclease [Aeromicrobium flavum]